MNGKKRHFLLQCLREGHPRPYFKVKIAELRAFDPSTCKPFGQQVCVLIVDCWYGWLDADFRAYFAHGSSQSTRGFVSSSCPRNFFEAEKFGRSGHQCLVVLGECGHRVFSCERPKIY